MRGDMQVRFGGRYGKTYCRKAVRRSVPSLRLGKGGGIIELAAHLYATDHVPYILKRIAGIFLFWQAKLFRTEFPTVGDCSVIVPCPACLLAGKRNKYGTGKKRM
jgi:hypothetical protein